MSCPVHAQELCISLYAAARLPAKPPATWLQSALDTAARRFDADFDAPAFALTAHSLGRLRYRPSRPWMTAFLESSQGLLYDFRWGLGGGLRAAACTAASVVDGHGIKPGPSGACKEDLPLAVGARCVCFVMTVMAPRCTELWAYPLIDGGR